LFNYIPFLYKLIQFTYESHKNYENFIKAYDKLEILITLINGASKEAEAAYNLIVFQSRFNPIIIYLYYNYLLLFYKILS